MPYRSLSPASNDKMKTDLLRVQVQAQVQVQGQMNTVSFKGHYHRPDVFVHNPVTRTHSFSGARGCATPAKAASSGCNAATKKAEVFLCCCHAHAKILKINRYMFAAGFAFLNRVVSPAIYSCAIQRYE